MGATQQLVVEDMRQDEDEMKKMQLQEKQKRSHKITETRKKMLDAIGNDSYNGVDLFEGTIPLTRGGSSSSTAAPQGALSDIDPSDTGVDISQFVGKVDIWKALAKG